jgi:phosphinothricin acetyltransferase
MTHTARIEDCSEDHMEAVQSIYARYVGSSLATFEVEPPTIIQMLSRRMETLRSGHPYLVAVRDGEVVGYAYSSAYRPRPAYRHTVENSVYVAAHCHGCGIGRQLLDALIARCEEKGFRQMVAVIGDSANAASIGLHRAAGFQHVGTLRNVGHKFGRWIDTVLMQLELRPSKHGGTTSTTET